MHRSLAASITAAALLAAAHATHAGQPESDPAQLLSGPKVTQSTTAATLVQRDFNGRLERIETRPEAAAIALLALTDEERAAVDAFLVQRAAAVTAALFEHMDLFLEIQSARQSGDMEGARPLMRQLREKVPALVSPPLARQVAAVLPESVRSEFTRLVTEYTTALAAEESAARGRPGDEGAAPAAEPALRRRNAGAHGNDPRVATRIETSQLVREMARSLSSVVSERRERTEAMLAAVDATPEQQAKITAILRRSEEDAVTQARDGSLAPSAERRDQSIRQIMQILTAEQRRKLRDHLRQSE